MTRWFALAALAFAAGCDVCPAKTIDAEKFASVAQFHDDLVACTNRHDCDQLCIDVFQLGAQDSLESCAIKALVPAGGLVHVRYLEAQTCGDGSSDVVVIGGSDDGGDDCSDGSCDPPPDDPCSDGSCDPPPDDPPPDDTSTDDGSDDGSELRKATPTAPVIRPAS